MDRRADILDPENEGRGSAPYRRSRSVQWPGVSIVIPTYQRRGIVCGTVRELARTVYSGPLELIVVVDGSTDGTADSLAELDVPFPCRVFKQPHQGASAARNLGASKAAHEIILFLDDDMMVEPDLVEEHAKVYRDGADAVIGQATIHPDSPPGFLPVSVARGIAASPVRSPLSPFDIFTGQLSVRRSAFEQLGGFDPALTTAPAFGNEDADFGVRLLRRFDVRYNPHAISRQHYSVKPREYMERAKSAGAADVRFARKHPHLASQLFELKGASRPITRFVYRPIAHFPLVGNALGRLAVGLAELLQHTPMRSSRALARFFSGARAIRYWSELHTNDRARAKARVLVLCYHSVRDDCDDAVLQPYTVSRALFATQMDSLSKRGFAFIGPDQLAAFLAGNAALPHRAALLTFDDGYADLLALAHDELRPRRIKGLVFVVSALRSNEWDRASGAGPVQLLSADQLRMAASLGLQTGAHSRTHQFLPSLEPDQLIREIEGSRADLAQAGLPPPRFFAYPFGGRNAACREAVEKAGFLAAFGPRQGKLAASSPLFDLPRVQILAADRGWRFRAKTTMPEVYAWAARSGAALRRRSSRLIGLVGRG